MAGQPQLAFVNFTKDSYITIEGTQTADRFFIIRSGKVRISKEVEIVAEEGGNILGPGDFFAVVATMSSHSHIETAQALTDVSLISVQKEQYPYLIQQNKAVAMKIILHFSKRMRHLDEALTRQTFKHNAESDPSHLFTVGEYYEGQQQYDQAYYAFQQYLKYCPQGKEVQNVRDRMMKIAPHAHSAKTNFDPDELTRNYPASSMIFAEGEPGDELYIIQKGSVKIAKIVDNNKVLLAVLKAGDIFGEMALLEAKPRAASAVAYDDCQVLVINRANFEQMIAAQPQIIARLTTLFAERIWFIYKQLANTLLSEPLGRMYDALLMQLEKDRVNLKTTRSHQFGFGSKELVNMVGLSPMDGSPLLYKILKSGNVQEINNRIFVTDVAEVIVQAEYYRKMQRLGLSRNE